MSRYKRVVALLAVPVLAHGSASAAGSNAEIAYGTPAAWVQPPPIPTVSPTAANLPLRIIYSDTQLHVLSAGVEIYNGYRVQILKPEALQLGNLTINWNPASGGATVHQVRIIRDKQTIDVLKESRFKVIQREGALEQSTLTGDLTAILQVPGLRVGDELEIMTTLRSRDPTLGDHVFGLLQFPTQGAPGSFRYRLSWPEAKHLSLQASRDLAAAVPVRERGEQVVNYELRDPGGVIFNDGAPGRFNIRRLLEYSDFAGWQDVSRTFWPLFSSAAAISATSPLQAQVSRIAAASSAPADRALAALRLVQDDVRYVYVGLDGGNYRPASAEETWARRFGDCKAKTALLLALLHDLGITAEAVLVQANGDDGLDGRLPNASVFNHVLVRARIGNRDYWLDGTRSGDRDLSMLPEPSFTWGLPVSQAGAGLEPVTVRPYSRPQFIGILNVDATAGFDKPAKVSVQYVIRGDEAFVVQTNLSALSIDDADRALRTYWNQQEGWVEADKVSWRFDEKLKTTVLNVAGTAKLEWTGNAEDGHNLTIWGAGFVPPSKLRRPSEQDGTAPWMIEFPRFKCWGTSIRLPQPGSNRGWAFDADAMNRKIGGVTYWRQAGLRSGLIRTVMSRSVELSEISAELARAQNDAIPGFNNNKSSVFEASPGSTVSAAGGDKLPFGDDVDWTTDDSACIARATN